MKKTLLVMAMLCASSLAFADKTSGPVTGTAGQQQQQQQTQTTDTVSTSAASTDGNTQVINFNTPENSTSSTRVHYSGSQTIRNVPSVSGPPLVSSNDTCMGSASGSVNGPGFGVGLGKTYTDDNCVMLKNSREMWNMGMKAAAMALMCNDSKNREALELTGYECPQTARDRKAAEQSASAPKQQYTDPIVRERLGLPPLAAAK